MHITTAGTNAAQATAWADSRRGEHTCRNFVRYLASAFGCRMLAVDGDVPGAATAWSSRLENIEVTELPASLRTLVLEDACVFALIWDIDSEAAWRCLQRVSAAMVDAPVGVLLLRSGGAHTGIVGFLRHRLDAAHLDPEFLGTDGMHVVAVLRSARTPPLEHAPCGFRVLAIVPAYNEQDIIAQTLTYLIAQGIAVHLIDNWSTDRTLGRARSFLTRGLVAIERFPPDEPAMTYDLSAIMHRVEQIAASSVDAGWIMLHDADERRCSPWPGLSLRDALWNAERRGFNCVDHVTLNFPPVDDTFAADAEDLEAHFRHCEFSAHEGHFHQRRAWRQLDQPVLLAASAGHDVQFEARRVFPYKFLLKHFPIRSRAHGERKVLCERALRWNVQERSQGWHRQYDGLRPAELIRRPETLLPFDEETFAERHLVERLSGAGIFEHPPGWATPPHW